MRVSSERLVKALSRSKDGQSHLLAEKLKVLAQCVNIKFSYFPPSHPGLDVCHEAGGHGGYENASKNVHQIQMNSSTTPLQP